MCIERCTHGSAGGVGKRASAPRPAPTQLEERHGVRPPYGYVVLGTGQRHRVENDAKLRAWVLDLAGQIREARMQLNRPLPVRPKPNLCRSCGQKQNCSLRIG